MSKPITTTIRDTLEASRVITKISQHTDKDGIRNVSVTTLEEVAKLTDLKTRVDSARRVVLNSLSNEGYVAQVKSRFQTASATPEGSYILETKIISKVAK